MQAKEVVALGASSHALSACERQAARRGEIKQDAVPVWRTPCCQNSVWERSEWEEKSGQKNPIFSFVAGRR